MKNILPMKLILTALFALVLTGSALARSIYGYVGRWYFPTLSAAAYVELYRTDGTFMGITQTYWHPFGIFRNRYHFNNVPHGTYFVVVRPILGGGWKCTSPFRTGPFPWSDTRAPDVVW
jgi:hypothetical protein